MAMTVAVPPWQRIGAQQALLFGVAESTSDAGLVETC